MAIVAQGNVEQRPLAEILWSIHWRRMTGCLSLQQPPQRKELYFRDGVPFFARSTMKSEALGRFLLNRGAISADAYEKATLQSIQEHQKLGDALVKTGALTRQELDGALLEQIRERFLGAFTLRHAEFRFTDELPIDVSREQGRIDLLGILRDGIFRHLDFDFLTRALEAWSRGPVQRTASFNLLILSLPLDAEEARLVSTIDGHRRIGDLLRQTGHDATRLFPMLYMLRSVGLLRAESEPEPSFALPSSGATSAEELDRKLSEITAVATGAPTARLAAPRNATPAAFPAADAAAPAPAPEPAPAAPEPAAAAAPAAAAPDGGTPPPLPPPARGGPTKGFVPRTFGFVRHDEEEVFLDPTAVRPASVPPPPPPPAPAAEVWAGPTSGVQRYEEEITLDASAPPAPRSAPAPGPRTTGAVPVAAPRATGAAPRDPRAGMVQGVIDALQAQSRGKAALAAGNADAALDLLQKAVSLHPSEPSIMVDLASVLWLKHRLAGSPGLERALELADRAIATQPKLAPAHAVRALCLRDSGRMADFGAAMQRAVSLDVEMSRFEDGLVAPHRHADGEKGGGLLNRASGLFKRKP